MISSWRRTSVSVSDPVLGALRGAALAIAVVARAVGERTGQLPGPEAADDDTIQRQYAELVRHRALVRRAHTTLADLEAADVASERPPTDIPHLVVARQAVDEARDLLVTALTAAGQQLGSLTARNDREI